LKKDSPDNEKEAMAHWESLPPFAVSEKMSIVQSADFAGNACRMWLSEF